MTKDVYCFFFQAEDGIRDGHVTGVQTCALPILEESYGIQQETFIYAENSLRNKSILDIHNNIIRSGLEASSAIQGKADAVNLLSFNSITNSTDFSEELASKQQLLYKKKLISTNFQIRFQVLII